MKPVAIFRHTESEGPGYFATFLDSRSVPWELIAIDRGDALPVNCQGYSGLCLMGGPMSVNDALPWIESSCELVRDADRRGLPVIGHCLGGQLMSKAFGGTVTRNACKEIGWGTAVVEHGAGSRRWLGDWARQHDQATVFQWHGETFSLPAGAQRLLTNAYCANQMFVRGPHLAMQCHVEMSAEMIADWSRSWADEVAGIAQLPACVQTPQQMLADCPLRLPRMRQLADQLYAVWLKGLPTD